MKTYRHLPWILTLVVPLASACIVAGPETGQESEDPWPSAEQVAGELCERFDECNELEGVSVNECTQGVSRCVDDNFTESQAQDWATDMDECLQRSSCDFFVECWEQVAGC